MWDVSGPFVQGWIRDELGPEAAIADRLRADVGTLLRLPELIRRIEERYPAKGGAPEAPPLPDVELIWARKRGGNHWGAIVAAAFAGGALVWTAMQVLPL
jgi:ubiquinone biosynthesis protein